MKIDEIKEMIAKENNPIIKEKLETLLNNTLKFQEEEIPLVNELKKIGIEIESVWDLVNNKTKFAKIDGNFKDDYEVAFPVLVKHLDYEYHERIKEGIIRALTEKKARKIALPKLLEMFQSKNNQNLKWVLANALKTLMTSQEREKYPEIKIVISKN